MSEVTLETLSEQQKLTHQLILETTQIIYDRLNGIDSRLDQIELSLNWTTGGSIAMAKAMTEMQNHFAKKDSSYNPQHSADYYGDSPQSKLLRKRYTYEAKQRAKEDFGDFPAT